MEDKPLAEQDIGRQLLKETAAYAESSVCRRKLLLHYFGEEYKEDNCGNCDNCLNPKKRVEAKQQLANVLEIVLAIKENFNDDYVLDIVMGRETEEIMARKHDELDLFGVGEDDDEKIWQSVIRQGVLSGYMDKDIENSGALKVSDKGRKFIKKPTSFLISIDNDFDDDDTDEPIESGGTGAVDPALYQMLKDLRKRISKDVNLPPYVIFQDVSLEAMATTYPETIEELQNIPGVGVGKAKKYGKEFCELIKQHCEENEIERPDDMRIRTVADKSKLKVSIIHSIDRMVALDDIAEVNGLDFDELLDEIEAIVYSGTKINIDYFLNEVMDEDRINDIYEYFRESETDNLDDAVEELGNDYTEEEIRLVRIKFISDNAN